MSYHMKMKEEAVDYIHVLNVKQHSTMTLLYSITQSQFIIGRLLILK